MLLLKKFQPKTFEDVVQCCSQSNDNNSFLLPFFNDKSGWIIFDSTTKRLKLH